MSREEKEKLLNEKMENIRKRNEELCKRHEEIEADKKNADMLSSTVTMDSKVKPYVMKASKPRTEKSERPRDANNMSNLPRPSDIMPSRQRLSEDDGPPPDPSYRFLSDPDRDGDEREKKREGRGKRKGKNVSKGSSEEEGGKCNVEGDNLDGTQKEGSGDTSFGNEEDKNNMQGKGRGKDHGKRDMTNEQKHGMGRGRGRGRGFDRTVLSDEGRQNDNKVPYSPREGNDSSRGRKKSGPSFASRDIRYYPDDDDDRMVGRHGKMRGRERRGFNQRRYSEESGHPGDQKGSFGQRGRGRGRGRNNDQQREYERWKAERAAIDEARLTRGRTDGGSWRREWDHDKISQGEANDSEPVYDPRYPRSKHSNFKLADLINLPDNDDHSHQAGKKQTKGEREGRAGGNQGSREKFAKVEAAADNTQGLEHDIGQSTTEHVAVSLKEEEMPSTDAEMKEAPENGCVEVSVAEVTEEILPSTENVGDSCSNEVSLEPEKDAVTAD